MEINMDNARNEVDSACVRNAQLDKIVNPFERRSSLTRSPPRPRACSLTDEVTELDKTIWVDEFQDEQAKEKRKRENGDSPLKQHKRDKREEKENTAEKISQESDTLATNLRKIIHKMEKEIKTLATAAKERNTKKEIKEVAVNLSSMILQITKEELKDLPKLLGKNEPGKGPKDTTGEERRIMELEKENSILKKQIKRTKDELESLRRKDTSYRPMMEERFFLQGYEKFEAVMDHEWPDKMYKSAFPARGSPIQANKDTDILVLEEQNGGQHPNQEIWRALIERYPDIKEVEGKVGAMIVTTKTVGKGAETIINDKWVVKAAIDDARTDWFESLSNMKELLIKGGRQKIAIYPPSGDPEGIITRKMLEFIFRDTSIKCLVYANTAANQKRNNRTRNTEVLFLKQEGKSYADLLKTFKDKVKPNTEGGKAIRTIREVKNGSMMVVLQKENQAAFKQISRDMEGTGDVKITKGINRDNTVLYIYDIDSLTTAEEVKDVICRETNIEREKARVGELRSMVRGNQAVTVHIPKDAAMKLLTKEGIKVGLSWCPVKERVDVLRCYKCSKYGHMSKECSATSDGSKLCRKCGREGHQMNECKEADFCLTCKTHGHFAGSGICPEFRKAVARERTRRKNLRQH